MNSIKMIGVCSYGATGSGAVIDILKEYNNIIVKDKKEFILTYFPDGFEDLEYHLIKQRAKFYSGDIAIKRFKFFAYSLCHNNKSFYYNLTDGHFNEMIDNYINNICQFQYEGRWMFDDYIFNSNFQKAFYAIKKKIKQLEKYTLRTMYYSISPKNFYEETSKLLNNIYNYNNEEKTIVLDQPFPANNPLNSMNLYGDDCKAIIVLRDPRDLYLMVKEYFVKTTRFIPQDDVYKFIEYYKKQYETQFNRDNIMYVFFEDLIFNYDETVLKIEKFCNLDAEDHINKYLYFDPKVSLKNTKLFIKNKKYDKDIKIIEENMREYLYDFSKTKDIDYSDNLF